MLSATVVYGQQVASLAAARRTLGAEHAERDAEDDLGGSRPRITFPVGSRPTF